MSWQDRDYGSENPMRNLGKPGGDWHGMRPSFDNPMSWSLPLMRVGGILVRLHLFFLIFMIITMLQAAFPAQGVSTSLNVKLTAIMMGSLFFIVLAHEFGHCLACRWAGGSADEILMWPLGGLAMCQPGHHWKAHFITAVGGPMVNVIICIVTGLILGLVTGQWLGVALPNPLDPFAAAGNLGISQSLALQALVIIHASSLVLLLFNLLPMFPLDGGRILQTLLWPRIGYRRSMVFSVRAGFVGAIALAVFGAVMNEWMLIGVAVFGLATCYITLKQLEWTDAMLEDESDSYVLTTHGGDDPSDAPQKPRRAERQAEKQAQREKDDADEVDRILKKIAESGLDSLSRAERALLQRETDRKRQGR